jgi:hypothetical protein
VWNTLDELKQYTQLLVSDDRLRNRMAAAARERAQRFGRERFIERMSALCGVTVARPSVQDTLQYATR